MTALGWLLFAGAALVSFACWLDSLMRNAEDGDDTALAEAAGVFVEMDPAKVAAMRAFLKEQAIVESDFRIWQRELEDAS